MFQRNKPTRKPPYSLEIPTSMLQVVDAICLGYPSISRERIIVLLKKYHYSEQKVREYLDQWMRTTTSNQSLTTFHGNSLSDPLNQNPFASSNAIDIHSPILFINNNNNNNNNRNELTDKFENIKDQTIAAASPISVHQEHVTTNFESNPNSSLASESNSNKINEVTVTSSKNVKAKRKGNVSSHLFKLTCQIDSSALSGSFSDTWMQITQFRNSLNESLFELSGLLKEEIKGVCNTQHVESLPRSTALHIDLVNRQLAELESFEQNLHNFITQNNTMTPEILNGVETREKMRHEVLDNLRNLSKDLQDQLSKFEQNEKLVSNISEMERLLNLVQPKYQTINSNTTQDSNFVELLSNAEKYTEYIKKANQKLSLAFQRTNKAYFEFLNALHDEKTMIEEFKNETQVSSEDCAQTIVQLTPTFIQCCKNSDTLNLNESVTHIKELESFYSKKIDEMRIFMDNTPTPDLTTIENIYSTLCGLKSELRDAKRNHLKLKFMKESHEIDGASKEVLLALESQVQQASAVVNECEQKIQTLEKDIETLSQTHPEVTLYLNTISKQDIPIPNLLKDSKLEVKRSLKDYEILKYINPRVLKVKFANKISILKQYSFSNDSSRRQFIKEVHILYKLNHPCVVKLEAFFIEKDFVNVQMEYRGDETLTEWLSTNPSEFEKRHIFHSIAQTIKYIHDNGIIHCDIKPDNIVLSPLSRTTRSEPWIEPQQQQPHNMYRPILIDFDISKDTHSLTKSSITIRSTLGFMAPELVHASFGNEEFTRSLLSPAIDIWAFGAMMFKAYYPDHEIIIMPNESSATIPDHYENVYLKDLLLQCLQKDPKQRISAQDLSSHIYFHTSIYHELSVHGQLVTTEDKMQSFTRFLYHYKRRMQREKSEIIQIKMKREKIVTHTIEAFTSLSAEDLLQRLQIQFYGEIGHDLGGLTSNMYTEFFKQCISPEFNLFECGGNCKTFLPKPNADPKLFEAIGKILIKAIYDQRVIPEVLSPFVFKFLSYKPTLNDDPNYSKLLITFRDLELYDESIANSLRLLLSHGGVEEWCLDFSEIPGCEEKLVTDENKKEFALLKMRHVMLTQRLEQLKALKKGFDSIVELQQSQLIIFSWKELMLLCCGSDYIDSQAIISLLKFKGFSSNSTTPNHLIEVISEFSTVELRQFIEFVTGLCGFSYSWTQQGSSTQTRRITIQKVSSSRESLPVSHVCSFTLDMPDYDDKELLKMKLLQAIDFSSNSLTGFHII
ncbi:hypothetical protein C9374_008432 [Naegleria lovaniensis]|uniref:HECT-type E3 ubiquitin transferase n=1 Tax=Naegleria lovaniensis TaxID=51637 RepID=A0AA88GIW2_NAELO|nr:uncharacterized protein C9374_008432 [Naegleria lovaniensis]KAG2378289.1 hypothetical protein C9374_008432 [Naegleria lovaniensis]